MSMSSRYNSRHAYDNEGGNNTGLQPQNADSRTPLLREVRVRTCSLFHNIGQLLQNWWLWEIIGAFTSVLSLSIIFLILLLYDSSSLPDWPFMFNINSAISFFGTIAKLSLLSAVGAVISQSKWLWYRQKKPRRLKDLQLFDDASRGPWGSAQLLITLRLRHLAALGPILIVLSLLFDPFLQQVVIYPSRLVPAEERSTIVRAQSYEARNEGGLPLPSVVDLSMKSAIYKGIFDIQDAAELGIAHSCSSGNCMWPKFSSLAICNKCVDIIHYARKTCDDHGCYEYSLPGGPSLSGMGRQINSSITKISSSLNDTYPTVARFSSLIAKRMGGSDEVIALECSFWYCIQSYQALVKGGKLQQIVLSSWRNDSAQLSQSSDLSYNPPASIINPKINSSHFEVKLMVATALNRFMCELFTGNGQLSDQSSAFSSDIMQALYSAKNLTARMTNLAISMTNNIREQNSSYSSSVLGTTWKTETYVHVLWPWFSFPLTILFLSLLFLLGSIIETAQCKVMVWKSSDLAILSHGRELLLKNTHNELRIDELSQLGERAENIMVQLTLTPDGYWKLLEN